jgi:hypothetical protein
MQITINPLQSTDKWHLICKTLMQGMNARHEIDTNKIF